MSAQQEGMPGESGPRPGGLRPVDPGRMRRRLAAIVLGFEAPVIALGGLAAWGIFNTRGEASASIYLWVGLALTVVCVAAAGTLRRPLGFALGWIVQVVIFASALVLPPMLVVGLVFGALWVTALVQGRKMDRLTAEYLRRNPQ